VGALSRSSFGRKKKPRIECELLGCLFLFWFCVHATGSSAQILIYLRYRSVMLFTDVGEADADSVR
jgi:hypothetical protein